MADDHLVLMHKQGPLCTLTINRPEHRNALTIPLLGLLQERLRELDEDPDVRVVILRGAGRQAFSSGYDIPLIPESTLDRAALGEAFRNALACIADSRHITIAMVYGYCLGGGFSIATACDLRIVANTAIAGLPAVRMGFIYYPEGIQSVVNVIGLAAAKDVLLTGRSFGAEQAQRIGWANEVAPADELDRFVYDFAGDAARGSAAAVGGTKAIIRKIGERWCLPPDELAEWESLGQRWNEENREAKQAFVEKRKPRFAGHNRTQS